MKISCRRKSQLVVSNQVMTDPYCGLAVIFCGFISHVIGRETINIPKIFSGVHGFTGKIVKHQANTKYNINTMLFILLAMPGIFQISLFCMTQRE